MLFRSYRKEGVYSGIVNSIEEWVQITGEDYTTPQLRQVRNAKDGNNLEVFVPTLPARAKDKNGYVQENGTQIDKVLPPLPIIDPQKRRQKKRESVIQKIITFFNRFKDISNQGV